VIVKSASVKNLTIVTSMGVGATLIGLVKTTTLPQFTLVGVGYFFGLALLGYLVNKALNWWAKRKKYGIKNTDLATDI